MKERVRWGVLGWGEIARRAFAPSLRAGDEGLLVAVASRSGAATPSSENDGRLNVYSGPDAYQELLSSDDIDAVYVATPNHLHRPLTEAAADRGKHVLCEKPLGVSAAEVEAMNEYCDRRGIVLMEAMMARFNPQHARVRELIARGRIGEPRLFRAEFTVALANPAGDIRFLPAPGAGSLMDVGLYGISAARWVFADEPEDVRALTVRLDDAGADEIAGVLLRFPGRRLAVVDCGLTVSPRNRYQVVGTEGAITVERPFASPPFVDALGSLDLHLRRGDESEVERFEDLNQYALLLAAFHGALGGEDNPYPPIESVRSLRVLDECLDG